MSDIEHNLLNVNSFLVEVDRIPFLKLTVQEVTFPDVSLPEVKQYTPFTHVNQVGDHLIHEDLTFSFLVDERMNNYTAIYWWMRGLAFPESHEEFAQFVQGKGKGSLENLPGMSARQAQFSDVSITILSNHKNPLIRYTMKDCFPSSLSGFNVNVTDQDSQPVIATVSMKFTGFDIEILK